MLAMVVDIASKVVTHRFTRAGAWNREMITVHRVISFNYRFVINPEGEPRHNDYHEGREVDGDDVEGDLPGEQQIHLQAAVLPCSSLDITVLVPRGSKDESSRHGEVLCKLESTHILPDIDEVSLSPAI